MCGDWKIREKNTNFTPKYCLKSFYFGDVSNSKVLLVCTQDSRTSLNKCILTGRMKSGGLTGEGGVIWIPEPAWPLLGLRDGCSIECIRSHCISSISQNHLCHQHSWEPFAFFRFAVSFPYTTLWEKVKVLHKVRNHFYSNLVSGSFSKKNNKIKYIKIVYKKL